VIDKNLTADMFSLLSNLMGPIHFETLFSLLFIDDKFTETDVTNAKRIVQLCAEGILNLVVPSKTGKS
jgi:hypothetical protein